MLSESQAREAAIYRLPACSSAWAKVHVFPVQESIFLLEGFNHLPVPELHLGAHPAAVRGVGGTPNFLKQQKRLQWTTAGCWTPRKEPAELVQRQPLLGSGALQAAAGVGAGEVLGETWSCAGVS